MTSYSSNVGAAFSLTTLLFVLLILHLHSWLQYPLSRHHAYGYKSAQAQYAPFDRLQDPAPTTHAHLARVITGTCGAGQNAYVTINNKAEGSAPLSINELAKKLINSDK